MFASLMICTKDRAAQLKRALSYVAAALESTNDVEVVVVDNGSTDSTKEVVSDFSNGLSAKVIYVFCMNGGSGAARAAGILAASGDWVISTDDDCYIEKDFFAHFAHFAKTPLSLGSTGLPIKYGSGPILPYDDTHDPHVANLRIATLSEIPPYSLIPTGFIQGANMFVHKSVFDKIGNFNELMGAGTLFVCEDIEFAARASLAGFLGAQVPFFKVIHHHGRTVGSEQAIATMESYDFGQGAYYASLLDGGIVRAWQLWAAAVDVKDPRSRMKLARQFDAAASYLKALNAASMRSR